MKSHKNGKRSVLVRLLAGLIVIMMVLMLFAAMARAQEPGDPVPEGAVTEEALTDDEAEEAPEAEPFPAEDIRENDIPADDIPALPEEDPLLSEDELLPEDEAIPEDDLLPEDEMSVQGGSESYWGYCGINGGTNLRWQVAGSTLTIYGEGKMESYFDTAHPDDHPAPWYSYQSQITTVEVRDGVTSVGSAAFRDLTSLIYAGFADSVTEIGAHVFNGCTSLRGVDLPANLVSVEKYSFYNCKKLALISLPSKLKSIGDSAFYNCASLELLTLPDSVRSLGFMAFYCCTDLQEISIPSGVKEIPDSCFYQNYALRKIMIPDSVTVIGQYAFYSCESLEEVSAKGVYEIGDAAFRECVDMTKAQFADKVPKGEVGKVGYRSFENCQSLLQFNIPDGVTSVEFNAFCTCKVLNRVYFPASVDYIGTEAFYGCIALKDYYYNGTKSAWNNNVSVGDGNWRLTSATGHFIGEATGVAISKSSLTVVGKDSYQLKAAVAPSSAYQGVRWKSSNPGCAEVDENGLVRGVYRGTCTVTATTMDGKKSASCTVKVEFGDVPPGHARYTVVSWGADKKITNGYKATNTFGVDDPCTRGHFVMFLWKYDGKPAPKQQSAAYFTDVPVGNTYFKPVQWAYEKGITKGVSASEFGLNQPCTRAQAMTFLWRFKGKPAPKGGSYPFVDDPLPNATQQKAIMWGAEQKITGGTDNGNGTKSFRPFDTCNRGHIMHFLYKMDKLK